MVLLMPLGVVTVMLAGPSRALGKATRLAVICVLVVTRLVMVMPARTFSVAPFRLVPVRTTGWLTPITPVAGAIADSVGTGCRIVNVTALLAPPGVVTVMLCGPSGAVAAKVSVALIWLAVITTPVA